MGAPEKREPLRPRKVQPLRADTAPMESIGEQLLAIGHQLQLLFARVAGVTSLDTPEPAVNAKNRRFAANPPPSPAADSETAGRASIPAAPLTNNPAAANAPAPVLARSYGQASAEASPSSDSEEAIFEMTRGYRRQQLRRARNTAYIGIAVAALLCFLLGRFTAPARHLPANTPGTAKDEPAPTPGPGELPWPPTALARLNDIIATDQSGNLPDALQAATSLRKEAGPLPGLDLYLGSLKARTLHFNDANATVSGLTGMDVPPALAAAAYDRMGFIYSRQRVFVQAVTNFARAIADDPFRGVYYFHWGEALRRRGRPEESVNAFQQALARVPADAENESLRQCIALKSRLASIELGKGAQFKSELEDQLKAPAPSGYWLLTAAALALQENRTPDAVDPLQKAKAALSAVQFDDLSSDYFFRAYAVRPELASLLLPEDSERKKARRKTGTYFIDP